MTYDKKLYTQHIKILKEWIEKNGYTLLVSKAETVSDSINFDERLIQVNSKTKYEKRIYSLLHECGHLKERKSKHYHKKYPNAKKIDKDSRYSNSLVGRIETVEEEINAWREGEKLAKKLNIEIDKEKYDQYAAKCVITYINWASTKKDKKLKEEKEVDSTDQTCYALDDREKKEETTQIIEEQFYGIF